MNEAPRWHSLVNGTEAQVEALTSGNHAAIARWRREQSLARTAAARPDLIAAAEAAGRLTPADQKFLKLLEPASTGAAEGVS